MTTKEDPILVSGGGGFIGGHLIQYLLDHGYPNIRSVDVKPLDQWYQTHGSVENLVLDLRDKDACIKAVADTATVYNLAADMGGMGFIENNKALCMLSVLINTHLLMAAKDAGSKNFFYASSAFVYNAEKQNESDNPG
ncbi:MAG: NAD-dependent epimerase/dehydratase family protein, partial [Verrucomicrobiota bacterium]